MCLIVNKVIPFIAKKDIICYKIYVKKEGYLSSPYFGHTPSVRNFTELEPNPISSDHKYIINKGFHSFKHLKDAKRDTQFYPFLYTNNIIYKCIIPKGSKYYRGFFSGSIAYCSESIKLLEVCV